MKNTFSQSGGAFSTAFENFWHRYVDADHNFRKDQSRPDFVTEFFKGGELHQGNIENPHVCIFEALKGRVLYSRRVPQIGELGYEEMVGALRQIFDLHAENGRVTIEYETHVIFGQLSIVSTSNSNLGRFR